MIFYSDVAKKHNDALKGGAMVANGKDVSATLLTATVKVRLTGTEKAEDLIHLVRLPKGAVVVPHLCRISGDALGTAFSVSVGTEGDAVAYSAALDVKAAHDLAFAGGKKEPVVQGEPHWVTMKVNVATAPVAGAGTVVRIVYKIV